MYPFVVQICNIQAISFYFQHYFAFFQHNIPEGIHDTDFSEFVLVVINYIYYLTCKQELYHFLLLTIRAIYIEASITPKTPEFGSGQ